MTDTAQRPLDALTERDLTLLLKWRVDQFNEAMSKRTYTKAATVLGRINALTNRLVQLYGVDPVTVCITQPTVKITLKPEEYACD